METLPNCNYVSNHGPVWPLVNFGLCFSNGATSNSLTTTCVHAVAYEPFRSFPPPTVVPEPYHRSTTVVSSNTGVETDHSKAGPLLVLANCHLPSVTLERMSTSPPPTFSTSNLGHRDGMDPAASITVASGLNERRSLHDLRGFQGASSNKSSLDRKDGSLGRSSIRRCMLAKTAPRQTLNQRSKTSGTSTLPSWEAFRNSKVSGDPDELFVRRASADEKASHKLQLPPFQTLGIGAPHPDYFCTRPHPLETTDPPRAYPDFEDAAGLGLHESTDLGNKECRRPNQAALQMLTPPDDSGTIDWKPLDTLAIGTTTLAPSTTSRAMTTQQNALFVTATNPGSSEGDQPSERLERHQEDSAMPDSSDPPPSQMDEGDSIGRSLLDEAISITG